MVSNALLKSLVVVFGFGTGLALAQISAPPPAAPVTSLSNPAPEDGASLRALLRKGGRIGYQLVNLDSGAHSTITIRHVKDDEYLRSDGTRFKDLTQLIHDSRFDFSSPVPLVVAPLSPGQTWKYSGSITDRTGLNSAYVESEFRVVGRTTVATPAGERSAVEIVETRRYADTHEFLVRRFVDERLGVVIKEVWKTNRNRRGGATGRFDQPGVAAPTIHSELTLASLPVATP